MALVVEFIAGLLVAAATLRDVFYTVVVPGSTRGLLQVSRRLVRLSLAVWKHTHRRGIGVNFAPIVLVGSFLVWLLLLVLGFALMLHALRGEFRPPLEGFGHAMYVAGGSMATIGFGQVEALSWARAVVVAAGLCCLVVLTLAITYLIEVQSNVAHRDTGVLKITTMTGQPPCALTMLERYAALGCRDELADVLREGREWCATVLQSHASHPWLVYFRSVGTGSGWPAALGVLMDLALIAEFVLDEPHLRGPAVLVREQAGRLAHDLADLVNMPGVAVGTSTEESQRLRARLVACGWQLRDDSDAALFIEQRDAHTGRIQALADHLGSARAPLVPAAAHVPCP
jgi:hypothetical protein